MNNTDLSLYKPNPSVTQAFDVDESLPDPDLTFDVFKKLILARKTQDLVFLSIGRMLKLVRDRKLYRHLDFETFSKFLTSDDLSFSREKAYMYIRVWEYYCENLHMGEEAIRDFSVVRLSLMLPELKKIDNKEDQIKRIEEMKSLPYDQFVHEIKKTSDSEKPTVMFSPERNKWVVYYWADKTELIDKGQFREETNEQ